MVFNLGVLRGEGMLSVFSFSKPHACVLVLIDTTSLARFRRFKLGERTKLYVSGSTDLFFCGTVDDYQVDYREA